MFAEGEKMKYTLCCVVAVLLTEVQCQKLSQVVRTDKGDVQGRILKTVWNSMPVSAFMGIPYAEPPVGDLRFRDPVEAKPWTGVLNATENAATCIQYPSVDPKGTEDCLYLDVYTPALDFTKITKPKPVMVWIYGGGYVTGYTSRDIYKPDFFLEDDVIVVEMNYRLGPLGFLALGLPGARGNQGLKDQNMALQWVQRNIAKFGGDPNQVTIFGESAGSSSVMYHLLSPRSKGLFHRVIAQSGSPLCPWAYHTPDESAQTAHKLATAMGIIALTKEGLLDSLKKADVGQIISAAQDMEALQLTDPVTLPFTPTIEEIPSDPSPENVFLDDCPISKFQSGNFTRVPTMMGYNKDEGILFAAVPDAVWQTAVKSLRSLLAYDITGLSKGFANIVNKIESGSVSALIEAATIYHFSAPIDATQRYLAKYNGDMPVYYYRLSYSTGWNAHKVFDTHINGTSHGDDIGLLFNVKKISPTDPNIPYNIYRKKLVSMWTNFAKVGDPTPCDEPINGAVWKPSGEEGLQLDIGNEQFTMHSRLLDQITDGFQSLYIKVLPSQSACVQKDWNPLGLL